MLLVLFLCVSVVFSQNTAGLYGLAGFDSDFEGGLLKYNINDGVSTLINQNSNNYTLTSRSRSCFDYEHGIWNILAEDLYHNGGFGTVIVRWHLPSGKQLKTIEFPQAFPSYFGFEYGAECVSNPNTGNIYFFVPTNFSFYNQVQVLYKAVTLSNQNFTMVFTKMASYQEISYRFLFDKAFQPIYDTQRDHIWFQGINNNTLKREYYYINAINGEMENIVSEFPFFKGGNYNEKLDAIVGIQLGGNEGSKPPRLAYANPVNLQITKYFAGFGNYCPLAHHSPTDDIENEMHYEIVNDSQFGFCLILPVYHLLEVSIITGQSINAPYIHHDWFLTTKDIFYWNGQPPV